jgi:hypothetical protein
MTASSQRFINRLVAFRRRHGAWLAVLLTVAMYGLCGVWIWQRRDLLRVSHPFPWYALWIPMICGVCIMGLKAWRHRWLLTRYGVLISLGQALRDRWVMTALKTFMPWVLGDLYGYWVVGRRRQVSLKQLTPLWFLDKWLTFAGTGVMALAIVAWVALSPTIAVGGALALIALLSIGRLPGLGAYPRSLRVRLVSIAVVQECLHLAGLVVVLVAVLDAGGANLLGYDVVLVHLFGMVPSMFGGAGGREAATLLVFSGQADDRVLFLAAFAATLCLRVIPSLPGLLLFRKWIRLDPAPSDPPHTEQ